jgi:tetratricopeptide (TPR) repeat protein
VDGHELGFLENFFGVKKSKGKKRIQAPTAAPPGSVIARQKFAYGPDNVITGRYKVVTVLSGGMGVVYLCADLERQERPVALKMFKPEYLSSRKVRDRFLREGTIWMGLSHPNIVRAYGVERIGDGREVYLILEWVAAAEGKDDASLRAWLDPGSPLPLEQALLFALHIARGMRYATAKIPSLVHRDLKPENVLVGRDGNTRVTDFGLAQTLVGVGVKTGRMGGLSGGYRDKLISQGLVGTPLYMAPEQWAQDQAVDIRTDIYAFGCILYEMLAGKPAVRGDSLEALADAHCNGKVRPLPPLLPIEVKALIQRCMALNPNNRCQTWKEVEAAVTVIYQRVIGKMPPSETSAQDKNAQAIRRELISAGWSYHAMGLSYYDIGHYDLAGGYFERVVWVGEQEVDPILEAAGLSQLGNVCRSLSDVDTAIRYHKRQLRIAREMGVRPEEADALGNLGNDYAKLGDLNRAIVYFQQQIGIARELNDLSREGRALRNLGDGSREADRANKAIDFYKYALTVAKRNKDQTSIGRIVGSIGMAYAQLGDVRKAVTYYQRSLSIAQEIGDRIGAANALGYLGIAYRSMGDTDEAVTHLMRYLTVAQEAGLRFEEARVLSKLGNIYFEEDDPAQALEFYSHCLQIVRELGDLFWLVTVLRQVGDCKRELGQIDQAIGYYEESLTVAKSTEKPLVIAKALHTLGNAYRNVRDAPRAHPYYEEALAMAERYRDEEMEANIRLDFALLLSWRGEKESALEHSETALKILRKRRDKTAIKDARQVIGYIKRQKGLRK